MSLFKIFGEIGLKGVKETQDDLTETTGRAEESSSKMDSAFQKIAGVVAGAFALDKLKDFGLGCIGAAADANAAASQFTQVFGDMESDAASSLRNIADEAGITENRMKGSYTQIAAFAKTSGMDTSEALDLTNRAMVAVADSAAFYDRSLEDTTESLQSFLKGNYANDAALGLSCTETTRNAAANDLYGKSFKDLDEAQKQLTLLKMVEDANAASGALGQAARESDTWTNQTGNLQQAWKDFQATLGEAALPVAVDAVKMLSDAVSGLSDKMPAVVNWFTQYWGVLAAVGAVIGIVTGAITLQNTVQAVKAAMNAAETTTLSGLIAAKYADAAASLAALAPYLLIAAAIAAVIAIGVLLITHWDAVKAKASELKNKLSEAWNNIKTKTAEVWNSIKEKVVTKVGEIKTSAVNKFNELKTAAVNKFNEVKNNVTQKIDGLKTNIQTRVNSIKGFFTGLSPSALAQKFSDLKDRAVEKINSMRDKIKAAIDKIKGFFNVTLPTPKLKLPHLSITGKLSLAPPSVPKLSVSWYKKAMSDPYLFTDPTVFGMKGSSAMVAGEAGDEMMYGHGNLMNDISSAVQAENAPVVAKIERLISILVQYFPEIIEHLNRPIVLDDGTIAGHMAPAMDTALGTIATYKGRGN